MYAIRSYYVVEFDGRNLGGAQGTCNKQLLVVGEVDYVDIFVPQFTNNAMDAGSFHTHAGSNRVDTLVVRFDGYFGTFAGRITSYNVCYTKLLRSGWLQFSGCPIRGVPAHYPPECQLP